MPMDAPYLYVVKFWFHPDGAATILHWLDSKHMAEVTAQPGFRWSRRVRLAPCLWVAGRRSNPVRGRRRARR